MISRKYLMLAQQYKGQDVTGWLESEKLDGVRAFWDGGVTRGRSVADVPWANRVRDHRETISTGLWSRGGKVLHAPNWWLDELPKWTLDGELWLGRGLFQETVSIVRRISGDWGSIKFRTFDSPGPMFTVSGGVNMGKGVPKLHIGPTIYRLLRGDLVTSAVTSPIPQTVVRDIDAMMEHVVGMGGEGLILRKPNMLWLPKRVNWMVKVKQVHDSECVVVGFVGGKGKLRGLFGAVEVKDGDVSFELSGFSNAEREVDGDCSGLGGEKLEANGVKIKRGDVLTYRYASLTRDGVPREARYWRQNVEN